jgi:hypothetical protein
MISTLGSLTPKPNLQPSVEELQQAMRDGEQFKRDGHG